MFLIAASISAQNKSADIEIKANPVSPLYKVFIGSVEFFGNDFLGYEIETIALKEGVLLATHIKYYFIPSVRNDRIFVGFFLGGGFATDNTQAFGAGLETGYKIIGDHRNIILEGAIGIGRGRVSNESYSAPFPYAKVAVGYRLIR